MARLLDVVMGWTDELGPFTLLADGQPVDLTGMTEELVLKDPGGDVVTITGTTRIGSPASAGQVYYTPTAADFSTSGTYELRWQITDGAGDVVYFPNGPADVIRVFRP